MLMSLFSGFGDRLLSEVKKQAPKDIKIRVSIMRSFWAEHSGSVGRALDW